MGYYNLTTILYADDASFTVTGQNVDVPSLSHNIILHSKEWFSGSQLFLNTQKTSIFHFGLANSAKKQAGSIKFLGIHLDSKLSFEKHIEELCKQLSTAVYAVKKVSRQVGMEAAIIAYYALFHSRLTYGLTVYGRAADCHLKRIFVQQKFAIRGLSCSDYNEHCRPLFESLKIMSLYSLIVYNNVCQVRESNSYICHGDIHNYDTRGKLKLVLPQHRLTKTNPIALKQFNLLPESIRQQNITTFRYVLRGFLTENCLYSLGEFNAQLVCKLSDV